MSEPQRPDTTYPQGIPLGNALINDLTTLQHDPNQQSWIISVTGAESLGDFIRHVYGVQSGTIITFKDPSSLMSIQAQQSAILQDIYERVTALYDIMHTEAEKRMIRPLLPDESVRRRMFSYAIEGAVKTALRLGQLDRRVLEGPTTANPSVWDLYRQRNSIQ